jgi:hypothetical protein
MDPFLTGPPETFDEVMDSIPHMHTPDETAAESIADLNRFIDEHIVIISVP